MEKLLLHQSKEIRAALEKLMESADEILAGITRNTDRVSSMTQTLVALSEGQADIRTEIAALKQQIADAGVPIDLSGLTTAVENQTTVIEGAEKAIGANT